VVSEVLSTVSEDKSGLGFWAVRGYHKMRRKRKWHLMVVTGAGYLRLAES
jgi:hypothetical protein